MGEQAAFISAGGYHHHIGLNTWESRGGTPPPRGHTGLFHAAIRYPTRRSLEVALRRLLDAQVPLAGASDHGVSEALYLNDPDGNGLQLRRSGHASTSRMRRAIRQPEGRSALDREVEHRGEPD
jgi:catechol 2,3-dioxygenase